MNEIHFCFRSFLLLMIVILISSCNGQRKPRESNGGVSSRQLRMREKKVMKPENGFNSGFLDRKGNLWFGSNGGGVYHYNGRFFEHYTEKDGLCNNRVYSIIEDHENNLWFGTQKGLCRYDGKTFTHNPIPYTDTTGVFLEKICHVLNPNAVHSLTQDKNGNIWIGTGCGGAYRYENGIFTSFLSEIGRKQEDSLFCNWIPCITEDSDGNIWFASMTHGGVSRYDGKTFTQFMPEDGLSDDMVRTIYEDKSGKIWFGFNGSRKSGLTYYDGKTFHNFSEKDGLCSTSILAICEDKKGNLWLGSGRGNLCVYDGKNFTEFLTKKGERFDLILFIIEDAKGNIWFGGKNGLWMFDGENVVDFAI